MEDNLLLVVLTDVPPELEADWHHWYDTVHLPNMQRVPQVQWAARYDLVPDRWSLSLPYRFASVQGFRSLEDFTAYRSSDTFDAIRGEYVERYGDVTTLGRLVLEKRAYWRGREDAGSSPGS